MKKMVALSAVAAFATMSFASGGPCTSSDDLRAELEQLKAQIAELKEAQSKINLAALKKQIREIKAHDAGDNIKWNVDFRTAYDVIGYESACPSCNTGNWNQIFTNRLWLGMGFAPTSNIVFKGLLSYYKMYGQMTRPAQGFNYFDWVVNETPNPSGEIRVKEAYWLYLGDSFLGTGIPWTASLGRRPATDGLLINYREDQDPKSPIGHIINTEFDGASFKFKLGDVTGIPGMSFKLCMGRGMTNAQARYAKLIADGQGGLLVSSTEREYMEYAKLSGWNHTDLFGFIFVPYDDGQYSIHTTAFKAWNMPGMVPNGTTTIGGTVYYKYNFAQLGNYYGAAISFLAQGIGDGINDFLDDTNAFVSFAWSKTDPKGNNIMQGFENPFAPGTYIGAAPGESKTGNSIYVGVNFPLDALISGTRMGLEYNHGSKYWRSMTYAEDTLAGSKMAVRGNAYEAWINKDIIGKTLTAQLRYTYMDFDYTGSHGFFGAGSTPVDVDDIDVAKNILHATKKAQDIRVYLRYRY